MNNAKLFYFYLIQAALLKGECKITLFIPNFECNCCSCGKLIAAFLK